MRTDSRHLEGERSWARLISLPCELTLIAPLWCIGLCLGPEGSISHGFVSMLAVPKAPALSEPPSDVWGLAFGVRLRRSIKERALNRLEERAWLEIPPERGAQGYDVGTDPLFWYCLRRWGWFQVSLPVVAELCQVVSQSRDPLQLQNRGQKNA